MWWYRSVRHVRALFVVCLAAAAGVPSASALLPGAAEAAGPTLDARVGSALDRTAHRTVGVSCAVWDAATGRRVFVRGGDVPRRTASVMKLATTGAALLALGADHELETVLRATAQPQGGVLEGDLVVEGFGDPGLSTHLAEGGAEGAVAQLAHAVRERGVRTVRGDLIVDTSAFPGPDRHPGWGWQEGRYDWYMAPVTALTLNDACIDVNVLPGTAVGAPARLTVTPANGLVAFENRLTTVADRKKHVVAFDRAADGRIPVRGAVWTGSTGFDTSLACVDPPALLGDVLARALAREGVTLEGSVRVLRGPPAASWPRPEPRPGVVLARHATPLGDAVRVTNRRSQNLWAELLLRSLGVELEHDGSFQGGCRAVARTLALPAGTQFTQVDGSGLARENVAQVGALGAVLLQLYASPQRLVFMDSLARGGDPEGTLHDRFKGARYEGRVLAKTGTLRDTSALAGFVRRDDGTVLVFVILCEGPVWRARTLQDAVVDALLAR